MNRRHQRSIVARAIAGALLGCVLAGPVAAREEPEPSPESTAAYRAGYDAVLNRDWQAADAAFANLIREHPESSWVDDAAFWRCYATMQRGGASAEAFDCFENHVRTYPRSEWDDDARRAMVRLADQLEREGKGQYRRKVRDFGQGEDDGQLLEVLVALGEIGDDRSIDVILQRLEATEDEHLRARIVDVLEDIDSPLVVDKLMEIARTDPSEQVRTVAINAISEHESADAVAFLRDVALDGSQPTRVRGRAIDELTDHRPPDLVDLLKALASDADRRVAREAIDELGDIQSAQSLAALAELLPALPDAEHRMEIIEEIADFETEAAVQVLLRAAKDEPDPRIRRAATEALGDIESAAAREALIELLQSVDQER